MAQCPTCGKDGYEPKPEGEKIATNGKFRDTCHTLSKMAGCKDEFKKPLQDWLKYDTLSQKQWKFFCVIFKECTGKWPPRDFMTSTEPGIKPGETFSVPF